MTEASRFLSVTLRCLTRDRRNQPRKVWKPLKNFARILYSVPNRVIIEGHTDNVPISSPTYPSNWELSGARAGSIARLLEYFGIKSDRMEIAGYGSTRPKVANDSPELRRLNRRIDVLIKPEGY